MSNLRPIMEQALAPFAPKLFTIEAQKSFVVTLESSNSDTAKRKTVWAFSADEVWGRFMFGEWTAVDVKEVA